MRQGAGRGWAGRLADGPGVGERWAGLRRGEWFPPVGLYDLPDSVEDRAGSLSVRNRHVPLLQGRRRRAVARGGEGWGGRWWLGLGGAGASGGKGGLQVRMDGLGGGGVGVPGGPASGTGAADSREGAAAAAAAVS